MDFIWDAYQQKQIKQTTDKGKLLESKIYVLEDEIHRLKAAMQAMYEILPPESQEKIRVAWMTNWR